MGIFSLPSVADIYKKSNLINSKVIREAGERERESWYCNEDEEED